MLDYAQLAALGAVIRSGSFDAAATALNVTPSAVSQRIKLLEDRLGTVLLLRGQPVTATSAGQRLFRHVEEVGLLESTLATDLNGLLPQDSATPIRVAVNADSLDTWFIQAMAATDGYLFDLATDDQDHSAEWLRRGEVMAAVTAHARPVQGCDSIALGSLRYVATASPAYMAKHFAGGLTVEAARIAPALTFDRKDKLQIEFLARALGKRLTPPGHMLPSTRGFVAAALAGLGWGMNPEPLVRDHLANGKLVALAPGTPFDVPLYWQFNRVTGQAIARLTNAVESVAKACLVSADLC